MYFYFAHLVIFMSQNRYQLLSLTWVNTISVSIRLQQVKKEEVLKVLRIIYGTNLYAFFHLTAGPLKKLEWVLNLTLERKSIRSQKWAGLTNFKEDLLNLDLLSFFTLTLNKGLKTKNIIRESVGIKRLTWISLWPSGQKYLTSFLRRQKSEILIYMCSRLRP